jgi:polyribonucleotide nucleotidyltransferase
LIDGRYYLNPSYADMKNSLPNLAVAGMKMGFAMVECGANEVSEVMVEALNFGHEAIKQIIGLQKELTPGSTPKRSLSRRMRWTKRCRRRLKRLFAPILRTRWLPTNTRSWKATNWWMRQEESHRTLSGCG